MRRTAAIASLGLIAPVLVALTVHADGSPVGGVAGPACDPFTPARYAGNVPSPNEVLGFELGSQEVTTEESDTYLEAVGDASYRVRTGVFARSRQGRDLRYAVVGEPRDVRAAQRAAAALRNPHTRPGRAAWIADHAPAIAWVAANVHGNEESGADAALALLRDLADRTDCAARQVRRNVVTVIVPIQNPDGRELDFRRNSYGFDLNRDWFARTQPETDGKLQLLRELPGVLFIDDHEMGADDYFFPPNADPVHHEIADRSIEWINDLYGASMAAEFDRQGIPYFNYDIYDLLYMGYGDTVPTTGFLGAGMTFEKNNADPIDERVYEQRVAVWSSLSALATNKDRVLRGWAANYREAYREGVRGELEPNAVFAPGSELEQQVPDETIRNYFLPPTWAKRAEVRDLVRRLQRMDVKVRVLTRSLAVRDYRSYGTERPRRAVLPRGTYWIPMAQAQKHWVQAMLGEDSYVPFPYFYDVTAWSGPLLYNIWGGRSARVVHPRWRPAPHVGPRPSPGHGRHDPKVGVWLLDPDSTSGYESEGWMRWLFDAKWRQPYTMVGSDQIAGGALDSLDVLVTPNGDAEAAWELLGPDGQEAVRDWVAAGGRFVGMRAGTELAAKLGLTTARLAAPTSDIPGSLIRAKVTYGPLAKGVGRTVWSFYEYDNVMTADPAVTPVTFPAVDSPTWFISGYQRGAEELAGTATVVDERYGDGRVVVFAGEPNFRGFTDGTQKIVWNAVYGRDTTAAVATGVRDDRKAASRAVKGLRSYDDRLVVTVRTTARDQVLATFRHYGLSPRAVRVGDDLIQYRVPTGPSEQSRYARSLARDLAEIGPGIRSMRVP